VKGQAKSIHKLKKKQEPPLPNPFPLPVNYAPIVNDGMAKGKLTGKARTKFIATVASSIFGIKMSPSKVELAQVAKQIAAEYPSVGATESNLVSYEYIYCNNQYVVYTCIFEVYVASYVRILYFCQSLLS